MYMKLEWDEEVKEDIVNYEIEVGDEVEVIQKCTSVNGKAPKLVRKAKEIQYGINPEQLLEILNKGMEAGRKLLKLGEGGLERAREGQKWAKSFERFDINFRLTPLKPKFKEFNIKTKGDKVHTVKYDGVSNFITIGCQKLIVKDLKVALKHLLADGHSTTSNTSIIAYATRNGIIFAGTLVSYEQAELLAERIKDL